MSIDSSHLEFRPSGKDSRTEAEKELKPLTQDAADILGVTVRKSESSGVNSQGQYIHRIQLFHKGEPITLSELQRKTEEAIEELHLQKLMLPASASDERDAIQAKIKLLDEKLIGGLYEKFKAAKWQAPRWAKAIGRWFTGNSQHFFVPQGAHGDKWIGELKDNIKKTFPGIEVRTEREEGRFSQGRVKITLIRAGREIDFSQLRLLTANRVNTLREAWDAGATHLEGELDAAEKLNRAIVAEQHVVSQYHSLKQRVGNMQMDHRFVVQDKPLTKGDTQKTLLQQLHNDIRAGFEGERVQLHMIGAGTFEVREGDRQLSKQELLSKAAEKSELLEIAADTLQYTADGKRAQRSSLQRDIERIKEKRVTARNPELDKEAMEALQKEVAKLDKEIASLEAKQEQKSDAAKGLRHMMTLFKEEGVKEVDTPKNIAAKGGGLGKLISLFGSFLKSAAIIPWMFSWGEASSATISDPHFTEGREVLLRTFAELEADKDFGVTVDQNAGLRMWKNSRGEIDPHIGFRDKVTIKQHGNVISRGTLLDRMNRKVRHLEIQLANVGSLITPLMTKLERKDIPAEERQALKKELKVHIASQEKLMAQMLTWRRRITIISEGTGEYRSMGQMAVAGLLVPFTAAAIKAEQKADAGAKAFRGRAWGQTMCSSLTNIRSEHLYESALALENAIRGRTSGVFDKIDRDEMFSGEQVSRIGYTILDEAMRDKELIPDQKKFFQRFLDMHPRGISLGEGRDAIAEQTVAVIERAIKQGGDIYKNILRDPEMPKGQLITLQRMLLADIHGNPNAAQFYTRLSGEVGKYQGLNAAEKSKHRFKLDEFSTHAIRRAITVSRLESEGFGNAYHRLMLMASVASPEDRAYLEQAFKEQGNYFLKLAIENKDLAAVDFILQHRLFKDISMDTSEGVWEAVHHALHYTPYKVLGWIANSTFSAAEKEHIYRTMFNTCEVNTDMENLVTHLFQTGHGTLAQELISKKLTQDEPVRKQVAEGNVAGLVGYINGPPPAKDPTQTTMDRLDIVTRSLMAKGDRASIAALQGLYTEMVKGKDEEEKEFIYQRMFPHANVGNDMLTDIKKHIDIEKKKQEMCMQLAAKIGSPELLKAAFEITEDMDVDAIAEKVTPHLYMTNNVHRSLLAYASHGASPTFAAGVAQAMEQLKVPRPQDTHEGKARPLDWALRAVRSFWVDGRNLRIPGDPSLEFDTKVVSERLPIISESIERYRMGEISKEDLGKIFDMHIHNLEGGAFHACDLNGNEVMKEMNLPLGIGLDNLYGFETPCFARAVAHYRYLSTPAHREIFEVAVASKLGGSTMAAWLLPFAGENALAKDAIIIPIQLLGLGAGARLGMELKGPAMQWWSQYQGAIGNRFGEWYQHVDGTDGDLTAYEAARKSQSLQPRTREQLVEIARQFRELRETEMKQEAARTKGAGDALGGEAAMKFAMASMGDHTRLDGKAGAERALEQLQAAVYHIENGRRVPNADKPLRGDLSDELLKTYHAIQDYPDPSVRVAMMHTLFDGLETEDQIMRIFSPLLTKDTRVQGKKTVQEFIRARIKEATSDGPKFSLAQYRACLLMAARLGDRELKNELLALRFNRTRFDAEGGWNATQAQHILASAEEDTAHAEYAEFLREVIDDMVRLNTKRRAEDIFGEHEIVANPTEIQFKDQRAQDITSLDRAIAFDRTLGNQTLKPGSYTYIYLERTKGHEFAKYMEGTLIASVKVAINLAQGKFADGIVLKGAAIGAATPIPGGALLGAGVALTVMGFFVMGTGFAIGIGSGKGAQEAWRQVTDAMRGYKDQLTQMGVTMDEVELANLQKEALQMISEGFRTAIIARVQSQLDSLKARQKQGIPPPVSSTDIHKLEQLIKLAHATTDGTYGPDMFTRLLNLVNNVVLSDSSRIALRTRITDLLQDPEAVCRLVFNAENTDRMQKLVGNASPLPQADQTAQLELKRRIHAEAEARGDESNAETAQRIALNASALSTQAQGVVAAAQIQAQLLAQATAAREKAQAQVEEALQRVAQAEQPSAEAPSEAAQAEREVKTRAVHTPAVASAEAAQAARQGEQKRAEARRPSAAPPEAAPRRSAAAAAASAATPSKASKVKPPRGAPPPPRKKVAEEQPTAGRRPERDLSPEPGSLEAIMEQTPERHVDLGGKVETEQMRQAQREKDFSALLTGLQSTQSEIEGLYKQHEALRKQPQLSSMGREQIVRLKTDIEATRSEGYRSIWDEEQNHLGTIKRLWEDHEHGGHEMMVFFGFTEESFKQAEGMRRARAGEQIESPATQREVKAAVAEQIPSEAEAASERLGETTPERAAPEAVPLKPLRKKPPPPPVPKRPSPIKRESSELNVVIVGSEYYKEIKSILTDINAAIVKVEAERKGLEPRLNQPNVRNRIAQLDETIERYKKQAKRRLNEEDKEHVGVLRELWKDQKELMASVGFSESEVYRIDAQHQVDARHKATEQERGKLGRERRQTGG